MDSTGMQPDRIENTIKELHNHIRHVMQLLVSWFSFFGTVNILILGWLVKTPESINPNRKLLCLVAAIFVMLNGLGISATYLVGEEVRRKSRKVSYYESLPSNEAAEQKIVLRDIKSIPAKLYSQVTWLIIAALTLMLLGWIALPIFF